MDGAENSNPETTETDESVDSTESPKEASDSGVGVIAEGAAATSTGDVAGRHRSGFPGPRRRCRGSGLVDPTGR